MTCSCDDLPENVRLYRVTITVETYVLATSDEDAEEILSAEHGREIMDDAGRNATVIATPASDVPPSWRTCYPWHAPHVECTDLPDVYAEEWARHTAERRRIDAHNAEMARAQVALPGVTP